MRKDILSIPAAKIQFRAVWQIVKTGLGQMGAVFPRGGAPKHPLAGAGKGRPKPHRVSVPRLVPFFNLIVVAASRSRPPAILRIYREGRVCLYTSRVSRDAIFVQKTGAQSASR